MTPRRDHAAVEREFRALLDDHGLPQPDELAHWRDALVLGWRATKSIVVIDLDEARDVDGVDLARLGDLGVGPIARTG